MSFHPLVSSLFICFCFRFISQMSPWNLWLETSGATVLFMHSLSDSPWAVFGTIFPQGLQTRIKDGALAGAMQGQKCSSLCLFGALELLCVGVFFVCVCAWCAFGRGKKSPILRVQGISREQARFKPPSHPAAKARPPGSFVAATAPCCCHCFAW